MLDWPDDRSIGIPAIAQTLAGQIPVSLGTSGTLAGDNTTTYIYAIPNDGYYYRLVAAYFILYTVFPTKVEIYYQQPIGGSNYYVFGRMCRKSESYKAASDQVVPLYYGDRYIFAMRNYDILARTYLLDLSLFKYLGG